MKSASHDCMDGIDRSVVCLFPTLTVAPVRPKRFGMIRTVDMDATVVRKRRLGNVGLKAEGARAGARCKLSARAESNQGSGRKLSCRQRLLTRLPRRQIAATQTDGRANVQKCFILA